MKISGTPRSRHPATPALTLGLLVLALGACLAGHGVDGQAESDGHDGARDSVTVAGYCEAFARAYCKRDAIDYQEGSARTARKSDVEKWLSNLFSPRDSHFTAGYDCRFEARGAEGQVHPFRVGIFLTRTLHFARFTQWERIQLVPITHVTDEAAGRAGYGVFKYLETPYENRWFRDQQLDEDP